MTQHTPPPSEQHSRQGADTSEPRLNQSLGMFASVAIIMGAMIGSGIFKKPAVMAGQLGSPELLVGAWVLAGIMTFFGALAASEIASVITATGGQYVYFRRVYGRLAGFLVGWSNFSVIQSGSIAAVAYVFAEYLQYFVAYPRLDSAIERAFAVPLPFIGTIYPLENLGVKGVAILLIIVLSYVNYRGVQFGGMIAKIFTSLKVLAMLTIIGLCFILGNAKGLGSVSHFTMDAPTMPVGMFALLTAFIASLSGAFWGYDGWAGITFIAGEVKEPQRTIPRALVVGLLGTITLYTLINLAYLFIMPVAEMAQSKLVASDVAQKVLGTGGGAFIAICVAISTFGTTNGIILYTARVYWAMARDNMFFESIGRLHPVYKTPSQSLLWQAVWSSALVLSGTFDMLTDALIFVVWITYGMLAFGVILLRKQDPHTPRPFKTPWYPFTPLVFTVFSATFVVITLYNDITLFMSGKTPIINSLFGTLLVVIGIPLYLVFERKHSKQ